MQLPRFSLPAVVSWIRAELGLVMLLFLSAGATAAFVALVEDVVEGETREFDETVLLSLRSPDDPADPVGPAWLEAMFRDITSLGSTTVVTLITLAVLGYLIMSRKHAAALLVLVAVAGGAALSTGLKLGFERPRPDLVAHLVDVHSLSFPSGHAMVSAVTYLTLGALLAQVEGRRRLKAYILAVAVMLALLVGLSRVYLGVHWPTDVIAGWCAGAAWATACWVAAAWLQARGSIEQP